MLKNNLQYLILGLVLLTHAFVLNKLIFFPYPELFIYPYLTNQGLKPYSQILDQHFPGLMFLPINFDNLGMISPEVARIWLIAIVIITQMLLFYISRQIFKNDLKALLVNILYLIWQPFFEGWVFWIDSFLPLILLPAFYGLYKQKFFLTGLLLGLGIIFKQVLIPLSFLVLIYIFWESRELGALRRYLYGLSLPIVLMITYLFSIEVLGDFWFWTITFNLTTYAQYGRGAVVDSAHLLRVVLVFGAASLILFKIKDKLSQMILIFLIGSLTGLSTRFDFVHFQPALPFAVLATVYGMERLGRLGMVRVFGIGYILITIWWLGIFYKGHIGDKVFFFDEQTKMVASKIQLYTKPTEKIFVFGAAPHLYQMSKTLPAGDVFVFQFPWFLKEAEDRVLEGIKRDKPDIIVSDRSVKIEGLPITEFAKEIDSYIQQNYEVIDPVGTTSIMRRK
ncbi:MAG: hypothetical protein AAB414_02275 [Patescibacteria group bacterium]